MGLRLNPLTAQFDLVGSGGGGSSYIDGEVQNFSALPQTVGSPAVDSAYLVREAEGAWLLNRKPAGIYIRTANTGTRASDWTYAGEFPDVFSDANFVLYDNGDSTRNLQFQLSGISTATTRTLTAPNADGTIARTEDFAAPPAIGNTTPAAITGTTGTFSTLSANNGTITASAPAFTLGQTWNNSGITFTALNVNVTNTASAAGSLIADFQVGGTSQLAIRRDGRLMAKAQLEVGFAGTANTIVFDSTGTPAPSLVCSQFIADGDATLTSGRLGSGNTIIRTAGAGGFVELRGTTGTTEQELRINGTRTSATNFQRMVIKVAKQTLSALSGASATTTGTFIPDGAVVVGVTTRVTTLLTGATGYTIGDGTDADRWGDITGTAIGTTSDNRDWTAGTIECFTAGGNVTLTAKTANFTAGAIEVCVFYLAGEAD